MKAITFAAVFTLCVSCFAPAENAQLHGAVTSSSQPVPGAYVLLFDYSQVSPLTAQKWELRTTATGEFKIRIPAGCYDLFVSAALFKPHSTRVCVQEGELKQVKVKLSPDPIGYVRCD